ncbi:MAG: fasciclin domain-containing protein, partial [Bacteroidetes bacterium]|nr:fasciclin domain-containing protein [Bacteroidota bacterium]
GSRSPEKKNIVGVAVEAGSFTILARALTEAGLVDALQAEGPFTVFAPTDQAFAKLPAGTLESLMKDKEALKDILLYHVVKGNVTSKDVANLEKATTLSGKDIRISVNDGRVMINSAKVTSADVSASNGVIHVIDEVLIPSANKSSKNTTSTGSCN